MAMSKYWPQKKGTGFINQYPFFYGRHQKIYRPLLPALRLILLNRKYSGTQIAYLSFEQQDRMMDGIEFSLHNMHQRTP